MVNFPYIGGNHFLQFVHVLFLNCTFWTVNADVSFYILDYVYEHIFLRSGHACGSVYVCAVYRYHRHALHRENYLKVFE
jgi:hypothetical protein